MKVLSFYILPLPFRKDCTNNSCEDGCGDSQYFTSPNGQISSLGFPSRLPPFSRCFWTIQAPENMFIALTFDEFNVSVGLGHNKQCMDTVFIDEPHLNKSLAFCGQAPPFFISTSNRVVIRYETSLRVPSYGFQTTYNMTGTFPSSLNFLKLLKAQLTICLLLRLYCLHLWWYINLCLPIKYVLNSVRFT